MTIIGIGWYKKDQWEELRRVSTDRDKLEATWDEWSANAERTIIRLMETGANVQKVSVDVDDLILWCRSQNRPCDGGARAAYVTAHIK